MSTRNHSSDASSNNRASRPLGPEETAATASRPPSFPTRCSSSCRHICAVFSMLLMRPAEALAHAAFSSSLLALLEGGPLLGRHSGNDITAVLLLLVLLHLVATTVFGGVA